MEEILEIFGGNPYYFYLAAGSGILLIILIIIILIQKGKKEGIVADSKGVSTVIEGEKVEEEAEVNEKGENIEGRATASAPEALPKKLEEGMEKTRSSFLQKLNRLLGRGSITADVYEELEALMIMADFGVKTTKKLIGELKERVKKEGIKEPDKLKDILKEEVLKIFQKVVDRPISDVHPLVIMVVGVNGTGKTTTIGKLGNYFASQGKKVVFAAGDTFRAAAIEQLEIWANRVGARIIKHQEGGDAAAVFFDTIDSAKHRDYDVVIGDTAGRLHTKHNLMDELRKIARVSGKAMEGAPHEIWLVIDAVTGQNALRQATEFNKVLGVTGIILTKLDGTAKGGIVVAIADELKLPVKFVGIGEGLNDLRPFDAKEFVDALFD